MPTVKDGNIYYSLKKIESIFRVPLKEVKEILVKQNVCYYDGIKVIPFEEHLLNGNVKVFESDYANDVYFKFHKPFIKTIFTVRADKELTPMTWKEAFNNLESFSEKVAKLKKKKYGYHFHRIDGFEHEVEEYIKDLLEVKHKFKTEEQLIISTNINYLLKSRRLCFIRIIS